MKRYFVLSGVAHESKDGPYCLAKDSYSVEAKKDGLWLETPSINGTQHCINLLGENKPMLEELWEILYNKQTGE